MVVHSIIDGKRTATPQDIIVVDEIQKQPLLLDEVHRLIEERELRFLLTGSSARKLKAQGVNLLAGRAWIANLFPLTADEIPNFNLDYYLRYGGLPQVLQSDEPAEELEAYVHTYIQEEIKMEGLVRKVPAFSSFLRLAAATNGQLLNYAQISSDVGVSAPTIKEYYRILEDTLVGSTLEPWQKSKKRKAVTTGKFYFFDIGVAHTLNGVKTVDRASNLFGISFEHWVFMELKAHLSYARIKEPLGFWRTVSKQEVDFTIGDSVAIEVKATKKVSSKDLSGLKSLKEENIFQTFYLISQDPIERQIDGIYCIHWKTFLAKLKAKQLVC